MLVRLVELIAFYSPRLCVLSGCAIVCGAGSKNGCELSTDKGISRSGSRFNRSAQTSLSRIWFPNAPVDGL